MERVPSRRALLFFRCFALGGLLPIALGGTLRAEDTVLDQLKARFNKDQGGLRLVVLVSPTCPECVGGAGWIEEYILKRYPQLPVKVYAVGYEMYPGDSPTTSPPRRSFCRTGALPTGGTRAKESAAGSQASCPPT